MRAVVIDTITPAEQITLTDIPIPEVKPGWALVKVRAFGLNLTACGGTAAENGNGPAVSTDTVSAREQYLNALLTSEPSSLDVGRCWSLSLNALSAMNPSPRWTCLFRPGLSIC